MKIINHLIKSMLKKLKNIPQIILNSLKTLTSRFPFVVLYILIQYFLISSIVWRDLFKYTPKTEYFIILGVISTYSLIMQSITIQFITEKNKWSIKKNIFINILLIIGNLFVTAFFLYSDFKSYDILKGEFTAGTYKLLVYLVLSGISLLITPFLKQKDDELWWDFTTTSAGKIVVSGLYSVVLFIGIAIALGALDQFWNIKFNQWQYELLAVFTFVLFLPLHFLSDVYDFKNKVEQQLPKFLEVFGKFILVPLIVVYMGILYPYMFSFPFKSEWPNNQATFIILAMLSMIYSVMYIFWRTKVGDRNYRFITIFIKLTNLISIPTILFWMYSLWLRVQAYGWTINRLMLMTLIFWFLFTSFYLTLAKYRDIRIILLSLIFFISLPFYTPFLVFNISQQSQINRLISIAKENDIYQNNRIFIGEKEKIAHSDEEMINTLVYLNNFHTLNKVKNIFSADLVDYMKINEYGYSSYFVNRYNVQTPLFFKETIKEDPFYTNKIFRNVQLVSDYYSLPSNSTYFNFMNGPDVNINAEKRTINYDGVEFKIDIDLNKSGFEKSISSYTIITKELSLMSFYSGDYVFIANEIGGEFTDSTLTNLQFVSGIILKK